MMIMITLLLSMICVVLWYRAHQYFKHTNVRNPSSPVTPQEEQPPFKHDTTPKENVRDTRPQLPTDREGMKNLICDLSRDVIYYPKIYPPVHPMRSLSFFGGNPIAPEGFNWPRDSASGAASFFMAQIDLSTLAGRGVAKTLPTTGVMYFFLNGAPANDAKCVLYHDGPIDNWKEVDPPQEMSKAYSGSHSWNEYEGGPGSTFPKWEVRPTASTHFAHTSDFYVMELPYAVDDTAEELWDDVSRELNDGVQDAVFGPKTIWPDWIVPEFAFGKSLMLEALPPVWLGIQIVIKRLKIIAEEDDPNRQRFLELYHYFKTKSQTMQPMDILAGDDKKKFNEMISIPQVQAPGRGDAVNYTIECCMTFSDTTAGLVDRRHAAHVKHHKNDWMHQSGGFPGAVQGHYIENDWGNALLMEFRRDRGQHWVFDVMFQYWISYDDLAHQRWDKVFVTIDGS